MEFGKNRVQYDEPRLWQWYKFEKYNVYFYMGGKELAIYTAQKAKIYTEKIEKMLDYNLDDKIEFMVFNKQSDYKQSNIGLEYEEPYNVGGVTKIVGAKVSLYFDGDHAKFDKQIKAGIAEVLINQMMYGGNVKDVVKNSTLLNLPNWYLQGLISYISNDWDTDIDSRVKDGILTNKYKKFNGLDGADAICAGHSIWNYIAETYGESVISNILYMTKVTRNVESAFLFVLGVSMKNLTSEWMQYYTDRYNEQDDSKILPEKSLLKKIKRSRVYQRFKTSPDGNYAVYTTNELGQYKVWLYDFKKQKSKRIMKREQKLDRPSDYSYPLLAWHPDGERFTIITEKKGELLLQYYNISTKKLETLKLFNFEKIVDFSYSDDGRQMVMSAVQNGQSDIFVYNHGAGNADQITKDIYDDLNPKFINGSSKIIFSSNRPNDTIRFFSAYPLYLKAELQPMENNDLFIYNYKAKSPVLKRVTTTPLVNETYPCEFDKEHLCFLSDENGIRNRYLGVLDSAISYVDTSEHYRYFTRTYPITNYSRNILEQDINLKSKKITEVVFNERKYRMFMSDMAENTAGLNSPLINTAYESSVLKRITKKEQEQKKEGESKTVQSVQIIINEEKPSEKKDSSGIDINNYVFDNEPKKQTKNPPVETNKTSPDTATAAVAAPASFFLPQQRNYFIFFSTDYVVTQLDNSFLNASYQKFSGPGPVFLSPGFTGFFKLGLSDLFDDYKITGGVRISSDLNSNEYYLSYENRLNRLDKQIILHRQALDYAPFLKIHTHQAKYTVKWPFTETAGIRGTIDARQDRTVYYAYDLPTLKKPNEFEYWGGGKLEFVFDNTRKRGLNLYYGTRLKVFGEYFKQLNKNETDITILGFDIRHYTKIHRDFIWANRLSASSSFGKKKLIYYMGGVDNWFNPQFNYNTPIDYKQNYAYQTLSTPMRGFHQNIRNGNSFALYNTELRLPLFRYLMNKPLKSDFLNNFQVVGFGDVGTAWTGKSPYDDENSLNTQIIGGPPNPVTVVVQTKREPMVAGYGWGIRSRLLGYFMRLDWSHGWEDGKFQPKVFYWSFSLDF
ncbi:MAG: PD40 domain-containing protein [Bacteroidetes bacterium]|nr:PD40 domain-containing protein [Bacteroidota bacterium]